MRPPHFSDTKIKQEIAVNPFSILENHELDRMKDLYKALYKISMISIEYNTIKSLYAKSAMRQKKGRNRMSFYKTQELSDTFKFNKIRS